MNATAEGVSAAKRVHPIHARYHNRARVLLCYLLCWGGAVLLSYIGLRWIYGYKLVGTAPDILGNLEQVAPVLRPWLDAPMAKLAGDMRGTAATVTRAMAYRDDVWRWFAGGCMGASMLLCLTLQLCWRAA